MTWSWDDDYRMRRMQRRSTALRLRTPDVAYAPAALALVYTVGLMTVLGIAAEFRLDRQTAASLAWPAALATLLSALFAGVSLMRYEEKQVSGLLAKVAIAWATVGAGWPLVDLLSQDRTLSGAASDFTSLTSVMVSLGSDMLAAALIAAGGGLAGAAAALLLCVHRLR